MTTTLTNDEKCASLRKALADLGGADPLTSQDFTALSVVVTAAEQSAKVARALEDGRVFYGTARHLVDDPETAGFLKQGDIRDAYLRITGDFGMESFIPVRTLMEEAKVGKFAIYNWSL